MKIDIASSLILSIILVVLCSVEFSSATNYCNLASCKGKKHIACNNNGAFASACYSNAKIQTIDASLQAAIVNKHNAYRNKIAKGDFDKFDPAARMAPLRWNTKLATLAAYNVKQCVVAHDACRNTDEFQYAGQNLYALHWTGTTRTVMAVALGGIDAWFAEYKDTTKAQINSYSGSTGPQIGHFTQMVQDKATAIGCAILTESQNGANALFMACNYAHTNILNRPVYVTATTPASQCTAKNPSYPYLCSLNDVIAVNTP